MLGKIFGSKSGRDTDKVKESGFTPIPVDGAVTYEQAKYTAVCRVMASQDIEKSSFIDESIGKWYENDPIHRMYIAEIIKVYENEAG
jgi:flavin reductase (DIM6/NTAB) family NADH-FMN oxidoreductase RutF